MAPTLASARSIGSLTLSAAGTSQPLPVALNPIQTGNPNQQFVTPAFALGIVCNVSNGASLTYSLQGDRKRLADHHNFLE
jgi:hypothetical protein